MSNPTEPQEYSTAQDCTIYRVNDLTDALHLYAQGVGPFWAPKYVTSGPLDLWKILGGDFCDRAADPSSGYDWLSQAGTIGVNLLLTKAGGWGRNVEITLDMDPSVGTISVYQAFLFGKYTGDFSYRKQLYSQSYLATGAAPIFPFASDAIPLYTFWGGQPNISYAYANVTTTTAGHVTFSLTAQSGSDDQFQDTDNNGVLHDSGDRNVEVVYLPFWFYMPEARLIPGRDLTVKVMVNGGSTTELSVLRFTRPAWLPVIRDTTVRLDKWGSCDLLNGSLSQRIQIFECFGPGVADRLDLVYSSERSIFYRDTAKNPDKQKLMWQPFGQGWGFTYGMRILGPLLAQERFDGSDHTENQYFVQDPQGRITVFGSTDGINFAPQSAGTWGPQFRRTDASVTLTKSAAGFVLTAPNADVHTFGPDGRLVSIKTPGFANPLTIAWNGDSFVVTDSSGRTTKYDAGADGHITTVTDPGLNIWTFGYDGPSLVSITSPQGLLASFEFDADAFVMTSRTNPTGSQTFYDYYLANIVGCYLWGSLKQSRTPDPLRGQILHQFGYQGGAGKQTIFHNDSSTITYTNPRNNVTTVMLAFLPPGASYAGWPSGQVQFTFMDGKVQASTYDSQTGHLSFLQTPMLRDTSYSAYQGVPESISSDNHEVTYTYDPNTLRRALSYTDENGVTETYDYVDLPDATDLLAHVTRPSVNGAPPLVVEYQWDSPGVMTQESETGGEVNLFEYFTTAPFIGLKQHIVHCNGKAEVGEDFFEYDAFGRLTKHTSSDGVETYGYDCFGNIVNETFAVGADIHTRFSNTTPDWLQTTETDFNGVGSVLTFDAFHSLIGASLTDPQGNVSNWSFSYDAAGNKTLIIQPDQTQIVLDYDTRERLHLVTTPLGTDEYIYDDDGNLSTVKQTDSQGQVRQSDYTLNSDGSLASLTHPWVTAPDAVSPMWRPSVQATYHDNGRVKSIVKDVQPNLSGTTSYEQLDECGRPYAVKREFAEGTVETIERLDALGQIASQQGPELTFAAGLGSASNSNFMTGEATCSRSSYSFEHDCRGRLLNVKDSNGDHLVKLEYNGTDGLTTVSTRDPSDSTGVSLRPAMTRTFDGDGREQTVTDVRGMTSTIGYDTNGRIGTIAVADGRAQQTQYEMFGRPNLIVRSAPGIPDLQTTYQYGSGGITQIQHTNILPDGTQQLQTYTIGYDNLRRPTSKIDPVQRSFSTGYNDFGDRTSVTAGAHSVRYEYDGMKRLIKKTYDTGEFTNYAYDALGNLTFADNGVTNQKWTYNEHGLLVEREVTFKSTVTPFTKKLTYQYDKFGHLYTRTDDSGFKLRYGYDGQDRLVSVLPMNDVDPCVQFTYTPNGSLAQRTIVKPGVNTVFSHDTAGEPLSIAHGNAAGDIATLSYGYSNAERVTSIQRTGTTQSVQLDYDGAGRLTTDQVTAPGVPTVNEVLTYDAIGNIRVRRSSGAMIYATYDAANQCTSTDELALTVIDRSLITATADSHLGASYDASNASNGDWTDSTTPGVGWISDNADIDHALTFTWTQPQFLALVELISPSVLGPFQGLVLELLDPITQQWKAAPVNGVERGRCSSGKVSGLGGRLVMHLIPTQCTGARIRRPAGAGYNNPPAGFEHVLDVVEMQLSSAAVKSTTFDYDDLGSCSKRGATIYQYDPEGRLLRVNGPNTDLEYLYGADGRLAVRFDFAANVTTYILHEGIHPYAEYDAAGNPQCVFVQAPQTTAPLGFYTPSDAKYHWYLEDARDSILHVVSDANAIENTYAYDAWGNPLVTTETVPQPLRFMSKRYDPAAGHYLWHMRVYDPGLGRFLQRDPLSASANSYAFLGNDPASQRDPLGLGWLPKWAEKALDTVVETAKELPGCLYEDFATGAARDRLATFTVAAIDGGKGAAKAAVTGLINTVTHPVETIENVAEHVNYAVWHPIDAATETVKGLRTGLSSLEKEAEHLLQLAQNDPDKFAEAVGRLTGEAMVNAVVSRATCAVKSYASDMAMKLVKESNVLNKLRNLVSGQSKAIRKGACYWDNWTGDPAKGTFRLPRDADTGSIIRPAWPAAIKRRVVALWDATHEVKYSSKLHDICHGVPATLLANSIEKIVNQGVGVERWLTEAGFPPTPPTTIGKAATMFFRERCTHIGNLIIDDLHENRSKGALSVFGVTSQHVEDWAVQRAEAGWAKGVGYPPTL